jgi:Xaa-Pro aminopeptidase
MTIVTYNPVLIHGRTVWDTGELPKDEFIDRLRIVRQMLAENDVEGAIILAGSESYGNLSYLTGGRPGGVIMSVLLVHKSSPTVLLSGLGGARGEDHVRAINYIEDVRYYPSLGDGAVDVLSGWGVASGRVGLVGAETDVSASGGTRIKNALEKAGLTVVSLDAAFAELRQQKRPREVMELERSAAVLGQARDAALAEFVNSSNPYRAALQAELAARVSGARDVRTLTNLDGSTELRPITEAHGSTTAHHLVMHLAVERNSYWTETTFSYPREASGGDARARAAVRAMRDALAAGVTLGDIAAKGLAQLESSDTELALEVGLGQGIGLGVERQLAIVPKSKVRLKGGEAISLRTVVQEGGNWYADSGMFLVEPTGARRIETPWKP